MRSSTTFISPASTRQVARVVAFLFLASVAVVVALTRAWPDNEPAIFTLLAAGMLLVVLFMDMVPPAALGRYRRPLEGIGAIVFLGLLMALTGGTGSPFLVGFFLVVAGTALSLEGRAPLAHRARRRGHHRRSSDWSTPPSMPPSSREASPGSVSARSRSSCSPTSRPPPPARSDRPATRPCEPHASMP